MKMIIKILTNKWLIDVVSVIVIIPLFIYDFDYSNTTYMAIFCLFVLNDSYEYKLEKNKKKYALKMLVNITLFSSFRTLFAIRLLRLFKVVTKNKGMMFLHGILMKNLKLFIQVLYLILIYMTVTAVLLFNLEPETFDYNFINAFYWSGITLTTVGYGDIVPITMAGKLVTIASSILGIGLIAIPSGIIAGEFRYKINERRKDHHKH